MKISKEFKIGIVVISAIAAFIWGLFYLKGINLFSQKYVLYAVYPKIDGLIEANPLMIHGFKVGQVNKISLVKTPGKYYNQVLDRFSSGLYLQPVFKGLVVQLVRMSACHAEGRGFESRPDR